LVVRLWTTITDDRITMADAGPTRTAASAAPIRWPLVPAATGKLTIWAANTNAATSPARASDSSRSRRRATRRATPTLPTVMPAAAADVGPSMNPSGTCRARNIVTSDRH